MNVSSTLEVVSEWPLEDRLDLAFQLWDQIVDSGYVPQPSAELKAEIGRRLNAYEADPTRTLTWEEVEAHVRRPRS